MYCIGFGVYNKGFHLRFDSRKKGAAAMIDDFFFVVVEIAKEGIT